MKILSILTGGNEKLIIISLLLAWHVKKNWRINNLNTDQLVDMTGLYNNEKYLIGSNSMNIVSIRERSFIINFNIRMFDTFLKYLYMEY